MALPEMTDEGLRLTRPDRPALRATCAVKRCTNTARWGERYCRDCAPEVEWLEARERLRDAPRRSVPLVDRVTRYLLGAVGLCLLLLIVRNLPGLRAETWWP